MQLFDDFLRADISAKLSAEGDFAFLNRSARPEFAKIRVTLQDLIAKYPENETPELIKRLRSGDDQNFKSAFFELLLYSMLRKLGFLLQPHPVLNNGSQKRPDFLVTTPDNKQFYLEAVLASKEDGNLRGQTRLIQSTLDAIRKSSHQKFRIGISHSGYLARQPSTKKLVADIHKWLDGLDADSIWEKHGSFSGQYMCLQYDEWKLRVEAQAIKPENRGKSKSLMGTEWRGIQIIDDITPLRSALSFKGSRYGQLDKPYVVAINYTSGFLDYEDENQALFGTDSIVISTDEAKAPELDAEKLPDGAWIGHDGRKGKRISGAWIFNNLTHYSIPRCRYTLYCNPAADLALPNSLYQFPHALLQNGNLKYEPGVAMSDIFQLPAGWPE